jgi:hypothetical protein
MSAADEQPVGGKRITKEVTCPACGGLIEASSMEELVVYAKEHTLDAHGYDIPDEHVLMAAEDVPYRPRRPEEGERRNADQRGP